ncbi:MAG: DUF547 domain-containing protein [Leptolyngbya sp. SIO1E4]|nr:DUF547 domain-containing protein [Leptolyngbya sp. SIO1E4]
MMKNAILGLSLISVLLGSCSVGVPTAQPESATLAADAELDMDTAYETYREVLETYVDETGMIDYAALQQDRQALDEVNAAIAIVSDETYNSWTEAEQIAYWVNAYNSITLASIINQEPIKASIKDIPGVWRITKHPVQSDNKTLDNIEHQELRANFNEPRIHAALVCAAISCPPLRTEPFTGESLDAQLDDQVEKFLAKPDGLRIDQAEGKVYLSTIFEWFGEDWIPTYGTDEGFTGSASERAVLNFISNYVSEEEKAYLMAGDYQVSYINYDWSLNSQR